MLTLTQNAAEAIRSLVAQENHAEESGLRIMAGTGDSQDTLQLSLAPSPMAGDEVVESDGARVFVEAGAVEVLSDKALDASVDDDGGVAFSLARQGS
jgi:Fe-S cluster assembly iron-binding protein IscA